MTDEPYNPLAKLNLARSIESEILRRAPVPMTEISGIVGAGVYALYYVGGFAPYASMRAANKSGSFAMPIYVGKAIPEGGRKGGLSKDSSLGAALRKRLGQHAASINEATNIDLADFYVRYLVVDDVWIPLGENALIETFKPLWNRAIDGFGNNAAGAGRGGQIRSPWDTLHPGRKRASMHAEVIGVDFFERRVADFFAGRDLEPLPKGLRDKIAADQEAAQESADEA